MRRAWRYLLFHLTGLWYNRLRIPPTWLNDAWLRSAGYDPKAIDALALKLSERLLMALKEQEDDSCTRS